MYSSRAVVGLALATFALFALTSAGRIDTPDGQHRLDVALGLVDHGLPETTDVAQFASAAVRFNGLWHYTVYSAPPSLLGAGAVALARLLPAASEDRDGFAFVMASALAATLGVLLLLDTLRLLGVQQREALLTCVITATGTLLLPYAGSAFDQGQHLAVALAALWATARALQSPGSGPGWLLPGVFVGLGLAYREVHGIWIVGPAAAAWIRARGRARWVALCWLAVGLVPGIALDAGWNLWRGGSVFPAGLADSGQRIFGNPLVGLAGLLVSPGKGVIWYSPPLLLGLLGLRGLAGQNRAFAAAVVGLAAAHTIVYSCFTFFGGDWCWGPRYMLVPAGVLMVAAPFAQIRREVSATIIAVGVSVQLLSLARDHAAYVYEARLPENFQFDHPEVYFTGSALLARPAEIGEMYTASRPPDFASFRSGDRPELLTRGLLYPHPSVGPDWVRSYAVFWLPVPWPIWMRSLPEGVATPVPVGGLLGVLGGLLVSGLLLVRRDIETNAG